MLPAESIARPVSKGSGCVNALPPSVIPVCPTTVETVYGPVNGFPTRYTTGIVTGELDAPFAVMMIVPRYVPEARPADAALTFSVPEPTPNPGVTPSQLPLELATTAQLSVPAAALLTLID